jgi:hypothetical protein
MVPSKLTCPFGFYVVPENSLRAALFSKEKALEFSSYAAALLSPTCSLLWPRRVCGK